MRQIDRVAWKNLTELGRCLNEIIILYTRTQILTYFKTITRRTVPVLGMNNVTGNVCPLLACSFRYCFCYCCLNNSIMKVCVAVARQWSERDWGPQKNYKKKKKKKKRIIDFTQLWPWKVNIRSTNLWACGSISWNTARLCSRSSTFPVHFLCWLSLRKAIRSTPVLSQKHSGVALAYESYSEALHRSKYRRNS